MFSSIWQWKNKLIVGTTYYNDGKSPKYAGFKCVVA